MMESIQKLIDQYKQKPGRGVHIVEFVMTLGVFAMSFALIAMMLIPDPNLLIADEPTSALDVTVRMQVLRILDDLVSEKGLGLMFISHDLNLVATFCDRVLIMYAGRIVESCRASELHQAEHPYTRGLLDSLPKINERREVLPILKRDPAWLEPATAS